MLVSLLCSDHTLKYEWICSSWNVSKGLACCTLRRKTLNTALWSSLIVKQPENTQAAIVVLCGKYITSINSNIKNLASRLWSFSDIPVICLLQNHYSSLTGMVINQTKKSQRTFVLLKRWNPTFSKLPSPQLNTAILSQFLKLFEVSNQFRLRLGGSKNWIPQFLKINCLVKLPKFKQLN